MVIDLLCDWCGGGEYGCSMIMLNSHHPFLPSATQLSSPPPQRYAQPPLLPPRSFTLTGSHIARHEHTHTHTNMGSTALDEVLGQGGFAKHIWPEEHQAAVYCICPQQTALKCHSATNITANEQSKAAPRGASVISALSSPLLEPARQGGRVCHAASPRCTRPCQEGSARRSGSNLAADALFPNRTSAHCKRSDQNQNPQRETCQDIKSARKNSSLPLTCCSCLLDWRAEHVM